MPTEMEFWTYAQIRSQGTLLLPTAAPQAHWLGTEIPLQSPK
jgi:hypothetical protein